MSDSIASNQLRGRQMRSGESFYQICAFGGSHDYVFVANRSLRGAFGKKAMQMVFNLILVSNQDGGYPYLFANQMA